MAAEDFDMSGLAAYLHMMPGKLTRLAERGKLPGRRIGGEWRFSRPEINQWLEERIGLADEDELATMETNLERADVGRTGDFVMADLLPLEAVAVPLGARTRTSVIAEMCRLAAANAMLWDASKMAEAVAAREAMAPTSLDTGVALLHPRRPQTSILGQAVLSLGVASQPLPFGGASGRLTDVFFLIAATSDHEYLRILARLSRIVADAEWLAGLRAATSAAEARALVLDRDAQLLE